MERTEEKGGGGAVLRVPVGGSGGGEGVGPPGRPPSSRTETPSSSSSSPKWSLLTVLLLFTTSAMLPVASSMTSKERMELRDESRDMFYHAYDAYLDVAFPADELMPLTCRGRVRGVEPDRGDIDDALGNFSLTLVDSLDTLVVFGDVVEFERGVRLVIENVNFDHDIVVSVFETNIRVVGGLISAHILAEYIRDRLGYGMHWYQGELLNLALDVGYRLLPAFNSTTGLPHPRVNLRHGIKTGKIRAVGETCTACAGTMILEFAALSRLSGEPVFEEKASHAMDVLWSSRHRQSNLVGNVLNINTGDWVRRDSGVGAGIDSYYEYVAKAYVLLGDEKYLGRWETHYAAIMKYLGQSPILQDVHMHRPQTNSKHFVDSLGAFWPGLQVLMGDIRPAVESHEVLYQVMQRHNFIPEAFTTDYQVHWGQHLLRPEFVESTYFLYRATHDPHYLDVGKNVLKSLQKHARVPCGYATIKDVRTLQKEDRMDSFVLAETFKYLYLLFAKEEDLLLDINDFVFTTEAHLLPLSLARLSNHTVVPRKAGHHDDSLDPDVEYAKSCPSTDFLFPTSTPGGSSHNRHFAKDLRTPLANTVVDKCPLRKVVNRKLLAAQFQANNQQHMELIRNMGIAIVSLPDGRVQLLHTFANALSPEDGEEGLLFMQEMIELSKQPPNLPDMPPKVVKYLAKDKQGAEGQHVLLAGPAQFGKLLEGGFELTGLVVRAEPATACFEVKNGKEFWGKIVVVDRGDCMFVEKARNLESLGAKGGIVLDNVAGSSSQNSPLFAMSGDGTDDISIPLLFLFHAERNMLLEAMGDNPNLVVTMQESTEEMLTPGPPSDDDSDSFDFTAPVKSFLEKSRKQMEKYFGALNPATPPLAIDATTYSGPTDRSQTVEYTEDEGTTTISMETEPDGTTIATRTKVVVSPDGKLTTIVTMESYKEDADGSIHVRVFTNEEVAAAAELKKSAKSDMSMYTYMSPVDHVNILCVLNAATNPKVRQLLSTHVTGDKNGHRFAATPVTDLVKLFLQVMQEHRGISAENAFELVLVLVCELENAGNRVDAAVSQYVDEVMEAVGEEEEDRKDMMAHFEVEVVMGREEELCSPAAEKRVETWVAGKEEHMVFPVLFRVFTAAKESLLLSPPSPAPARLKPDEL